MKKFKTLIKTIVCSALAAAAAVTASGCTNYSKMMKEQPADYISMAEDNTVEVMMKNNHGEEYEILNDALRDGSFTLGFEAEGISFNGEAYINEKDGKTAQTYTLTGSEGTSAQAYLFADKKVMKIGTSGLSGNHIYDVIYDNIEEKLPTSIFAPDSGTGYALEQSEYDMLLEYIKDFAEGTGGSKSDNSYMDIIDKFKEANPPVIEEKIDSDIGGTTVKANVITYDFSKEKIMPLWEQIVDIYAEDADPEQHGYDTKEELKEEMMSAFDELHDLGINAVYYVNSETHMLMKWTFSVKMYMPNEFTEAIETTNIYGSTLYGADPAASDTVNTLLGIEDSSEKLELYIDTVTSENGSTSNIAYYDGTERKDFAVLNVSRDGENYTLAIDIPDAELTCKAEGTLKTDKNSFTVTVDRLSAGAGSSEMSYLPKGVVTVKRGGEMPELDAEKELLDLTEEEMDTLSDNIVSDFSAVFDEFAEDSAMGNYIKKSQISRAKMNAKQCYTAAVTVLTEAAIEGKELSGSILTGTGTNFDFDGTAIDVSDYLGTDFTGYIYGEFDPEAYTVMYVIRSEDPIPDEYKHPLTSQEMEELAKQGIYIGCYPECDETFPT